MTSASVCLWFAPDVAPRAVDLYCRVVPGTRVVRHHRFTNPAGEEYSAELWELELAGRPVRVMGAAHQAAFTNAISMWLVCDDQAQLDAVWDGFLAAGGQEDQCGWITDPFDVRWQVVPAAFERLVDTDDAARAQRVVEAVWGMVRIDAAALEAAAAAG